MNIKQIYNARYVELSLNICYPKFIKLMINLMINFNSEINNWTLIWLVVRLPDKLLLS